MFQSEIKILVIEDNPGDYMLVNEYLEDSFPKANISHTSTLQEGISLLDETNIEVILLDLTLPDSMGIQSFNVINSKAPEVPIIILTGLGDTELALESLKIGAQDYIVKDDLNPEILVKSIQYGIERSKIRERLRKSEEQYKYLFHNNPLPMCAYDIYTGKFLMVNKTAINHYGYNEAEFLSMTIEDITYGEGKAGCRNKNLQIKNNQYGTPDNIRHLKKNGEIIDIDIESHGIVIEEKNACLAVLHDVTERNKARQQLRESEQMFRTISENFPNGAVAILDKDLTISYIAGKDFHIQGADASYFENTVYSSHFHSPESEKVHENLSKVFEGKNAVFEAGYESLTYIISAVPLYEDSGKIKKILIASQNITVQKRSEVEREMLIEELTNINKDLQQFSYITSHNLRAPLSNLVGIIKLIDMSTISNPVTTMLLKNFEECTLQLNDTVNDLLSVLMIKKGVNTKKEKLNLKKAFEKVVHSVQTTIEKGNMHIETNFGDSCEVEFNKSYLESIILNLITNAVKYSSPDRQPTVQVKTEKVAAGLKFYFSDNGIGIDMVKNKDRIFGLYQRFHDHPDSKGLGLYIVNSQVRALGGEIEVESEVDKGTTFIITFKN